MANNRRRGHQFERDVAILLRPIFPEACRKLEYQLADCTGVDLKNTGRLRIQCKRARASVPINKIKEIKEAGIPCLISQTDRDPIYITLPLDDFIGILEKGL